MSLPQPIDSSTDDADERCSFGEWDEALADEPCASFVGGAPLASAALAFAELRDAAGFDLLAFAASRALDDFARVRLVNHLRAAAVGVAKVVRGSVVTNIAIEGTVDSANVLPDCKSSDNRLDGAARLSTSIIEALNEATSTSTLASESALWANPALLQPVIEGDAALSAILAAGDEYNDTKFVNGAVQSAILSDVAIPVSDLSVEHQLSAALQRSRLLEDEVEKLRSTLTSAHALIARLTAGTAQDYEKYSRNEGVAESTLAATLSGSVDVPSCMPTSGHGGVLGGDNDSYYFKSYDKASIHASMLGDVVRTDAYRDAILLNADFFKDKTVLDIGCGTGILSLFAARAGAACVIALDASNIIEDAAAIVEANQAGAVITCVRGKAEDLLLPLPTRSAGKFFVDLSRTHLTKRSGVDSSVSGHEELPVAHSDDGKVDIIVSEWMGYALHYEAMLASVIYARDRLLRRGGLMLPSRARVLVGAFSDSDLVQSRVGAWASVYGFDMRRMMAQAGRDPIVDVLDPRSVVSAAPHCCVSDLSTLTCRAADIDVVARPLSLIVKDDCGEVDIHGLVVWFDVDFDGENFPGGLGADHSPSATASATYSAATASVTSSAANDAPNFRPVRLTTEPASKATHWQQTLLLFEQPLARVPAGSELSGSFDMLRDAVNPRELRFAASVRVLAGKDLIQLWHFK